MTADRRSHAVASLRGLAVGDALGSCFFIPGDLPALAARELPATAWWWTDDTEMACSVFAVLDRYGRVEQDRSRRPSPSTTTSTAGTAPG